MINVSSDLGLPAIPDSIVGDLRDYLARLHVVLEAQNKAILGTFVHGVVTQHISQPMDLSGAAAELVVFHAQFDGELKRAVIVYTEASSADAGVAIKIGKESDDDYFFTGTSGTSQSKWDETEVTLLNIDIQAGDALLVSSAGGKTGTGEIIIIAEIEYHLR